MAFAKTAANATPTICTEPGSGFAGSAIGTPILCSLSDIGVAEPSVAGCKIASQLSAAGLDGARNVDAILHARVCAESSARISRRSATMVPAAGTPEGPGRRQSAVTVTVQAEAVGLRTNRLTYHRVMSGNVGDGWKLVSRSYYGRYSRICSLERSRAGVEM